MEKIDKIETDYKKWLVFSKLIQNRIISKEFEKAISKKKSHKSISIITKEDSEKGNFYYISEIDNNTTLRISQDSLPELKKYYLENYTNNKSVSIKSYNKRTPHHSPLSGNKSDQSPKYLFNQSKIAHAIIFSIFTILILQVIIIPRVVLNIDFGLIRNIFTYGISLLGLWYCFKFYDKYSRYELDYGDIFKLVWFFNSFLYLFYLSEITLLSIPSVIPSVAWTSTILIGTLILGEVYILFFSSIIAVIFYFFKNKNS